MNMRDGVPLMEEYVSLVKSPLFKEMEEYSNLFLKAADQELIDYKRKWVSDPLHQWSRQWEYPYVLQAIMDVMPTDSGAVLDAGSGVTFFPYYIKQKFSTCSLFCCDSDKTLVPIHERINAIMQSDIHFDVNDLLNNKYPDNSFDIVYCISVIEHLSDHRRAMQEFHRILKPQGTLILTLDISLNGKDDIPVDKANEVILLAEELFFAERVAKRGALVEAINGKNILSTKTIAKYNQQLLPWKRSGLQRIISAFMRSSGNEFPELTVGCYSFQKGTAEKLQRGRIR